MTNDEESQRRHGLKVLRFGKFLLILHLGWRRLTFQSSPLKMKILIKKHNK